MAKRDTIRARFIHLPLLMKRLFPTTYLAALLAGAAIASPPPGALQAGTLANQKLIRDAMVGVAAEMGIRGCAKPEGVQPYILAQPQGKPGSRFWRETWVVTGCGQAYPVRIEFREDGMDAANWSILK